MDQVGENAEFGVPADYFTSYWDRIVSSMATPSTAYTTKTVKKWVPPVAAVTSIPSVPQSPAQIRYFLNSGWNTWARSIAVINPGNFIEFTLNEDIAGAFIGIGRKDKEGHSLGSFSHGVLVDPSGVWVMEFGVKIEQLRIWYRAVSKIRICRHDDNTVTYLIITNTETLAHKSTIRGALVPLYAYGHLYSSGDAVSNAGIRAGQVQFGRA